MVTKKKWGVIALWWILSGVIIGLILDTVVYFFAGGLDSHTLTSSLLIVFAFGNVVWWIGSIIGFSVYHVIRTLQGQK